MKMNLTFSEYRAIVENSPNMVWRANLDAKCDYFNKTWLRFTGRTLNQEYGDGWAEGVHPDDLQRCVDTYLAAFQQRKPFEMEYRLRRFDGLWRWINDRGVPFWNEAGEFAGYIGSCMDVTERVEGSSYKEMAQTDSLTGVLSRQYLLQMLEQALLHARTYGGNLIIAMLDIDGFKGINDTCGHIAGDSALKLFAGIVRGQIRKDDLLGRYGGDEFVIVFRNGDAETARLAVERIEGELLCSTLPAGGGSITLSMSVGLCTLAGEANVEELLAKADHRMYEQKRTKQGIPSSGGDSR